MKIFITALTILPSLLGISVLAQAQSITAVGTDVEMFMQNVCGSTCRLYFPRNNTGRIIKIDNISCKIEVTSGGTLALSSWGVTNTNSDPSYLKRTYFEAQRYYYNIDSNIYYISSESGLLLGAKYLSVLIQATAGQAQMDCAAFGRFAN